MKKVMNTTTIAINKATTPFKLYCADIKKYDVLTLEQEKELFNQYINGTPEEKEAARKQIILCNQRFVLSVAKKYDTDTEEILCLVDEGNIGLSRAIEKFNPELGFRFCSFAVNWINQAIGWYLDSVKNTIYRSNEINIGRRADKIKNDFYAKNGCYPSTDYIKDVLKDQFNITVKDDRDLCNCSMSHIDDEVTDDDGSGTSQIEVGHLATMCSSHNEYENEIVRENHKDMVKQLLQCLNEQAQTIIKMAYGIDCEPAFDDTIAYHVGLGEVRVKQIKNESIKKMAKYAKALAM
jgi:RNA polymerase sigma factor (sigma-70 family)